VIDEILKTKQDNTRHRWETAVKDTAFDSIRNRVLFETGAEHFLHVLEEGTVSTNIYLRRAREADRATEFKQRCRGWNIEGVTLHSYRYAWAERAKVAGYPERFAQAALGHNSKAVHRAYAKNAKVLLPSLASFEKKALQAEILPFPAAGILPEPAGPGDTCWRTSPWRPPGSGTSCGVSPPNPESWTASFN